VVQVVLWWWETIHFRISRAADAWDVLTGVRPFQHSANSDRRLSSYRNAPDVQIGGASSFGGICRTKAFLQTMRSTPRIFRSSGVLRARSRPYPLAFGRPMAQFAGFLRYFRCTLSQPKGHCRGANIWNFGCSTHGFVSGHGESVRWSGKLELWGFQSGVGQEGARLIRVIHVGNHMHFREGSTVVSRFSWP
jgi:hypothetical protein